MKTVSLLSVAVLSVAASSADILHFDAALGGFNEVPANASPASGFADIWFDTSSGTLDYSVTFSDLLAPLIAAHFHTAPFGVNGPVVVNLSGAPIGTTSGTWSGDDILVPPGFFANLEAGNIYINLHSSVFPGGEIRGQFELAEDAQAVPEPATWAGGRGGWLDRRRAAQTLEGLLAPSFFSGSGRPWARRAVRKCIFATLAISPAPCFWKNSLATRSTSLLVPYLDH